MHMGLNLFWLYIFTWALMHQRNVTHIINSLYQRSALPLARTKFNHAYITVDHTIRFSKSRYNLHSTETHIFHIPCLKTSLTRGSLIGSVSAWHASGPEFEPHVRHILSWILGHEKILGPFSLFRWIKKSSFQFMAKECALNTGKLPRRLAQEQCG